mmetsp:Transcript_15997/g.33070  ORF Transcript_15997/g.33070 Transcript_15997/m.33070 type:complete len:87 (+) Transcript_15997:895-1155(+)
MRRHMLLSRVQNDPGSTTMRDPEAIRRACIRISKKCVCFARDLAQGRFVAAVGSEQDTGSCVSSAACPLTPMPASDQQKATAAIAA